MTNKHQLGKTLISVMSGLSSDQIKGSILTSFIVYKQCILADKETPSSQWFHFHDLVALMWGYYGDLDLHIEKMEERWIKEIDGFKTRSDINKFIQSVGDFKESHDEYLAKLEIRYDNIITY
jgi:hypothetical protein